ncbi:MAG: hypothetical protein ACI4HO_04535 [Ruminococcus sp.]
MMEYKYEIVKFSDKYPAKIYLQNKPGRRCNTRLHWHKAMELLYIIDGSLNVMNEGKVTVLNSNDIFLSTTIASTEHLLHILMRI